MEALKTAERFLLLALTIVALGLVLRYARPAAALVGAVGEVVVDVFRVVSLQPGAAARARG